MDLITTQSCSIDALNKMHLFPLVPEVHLGDPPENPGFISSLFSIVRATGRAFLTNFFYTGHLGC